MFLLIHGFLNFLFAKITVAIHALDIKVPGSLENEKCSREHGKLHRKKNSTDLLSRDDRHKTGCSADVSQERIEERSSGQTDAVVKGLEPELFQLRVDPAHEVLAVCPSIGEKAVVPLRMEFAASGLAHERLSGHVTGF